jgi:hypothetical protein
MTDIRNLIENHLPLVVDPLPNGYVAIKFDDLQQLSELAHETVHPTYKGNPEKPVAGAEGPEDDETYNPDIEIGYNQETLASLRTTAIHYATAIATTEIQASHGLDSKMPDVIGLAEAVYNFLKD